MRRFAMVMTVAALLVPGSLAQDTAPASAPATQPAAAEWPEPGTTAPDFALPNLLDENHAEVSLSGLLEDNEFAVVIWNSITCPYCVPYDDMLPGLATQYADHGVAFVGINSNVTEDPSDITAHLGDAGFNFPVLRDEGNAIADEYGASVTPEVYIVDSSMSLRYHGRINDSPRNPSAAQNHDLINALDALVAGEEPPVAVTNARGCTIKRVDM